LGVHVLFNEHFLKPIASFIEMGVGKHYWITKPLFNCMPCMASIHGMFGFLLIFGDFSIWAVLYCIALCGLNSLISKLYYYED
jgi:hypothetical protein